MKTVSNPQSTIDITAAPISAINLPKLKLQTYPVRALLYQTYAAILKTLSQFMTVLQLDEPPSKVQLVVY